MVDDDSHGISEPEPQELDELILKQASHLILYGMAVRSMSPPGALTLLSHLSKLVMGAEWPYLVLSVTMFPILYTLTCTKQPEHSHLFTFDCWLSFGNLHFYTIDAKYNPSSPIKGGGSVPNPLAPHRYDGTPPKALHFEFFPRSNARSADPGGSRLCARHAGCAAEACGGRPPRGCVWRG